MNPQPTRSDTVSRQIVSELDVIRGHQLLSVTELMLAIQWEEIPTSLKVTEVFWVDCCVTEKQQHHILFFRTNNGELDLALGLWFANL